MENVPYFPPLFGKVDCYKCDKQDCIARHKYQRNRRDFTYTSGRCPRLPDYRGFMEKSEQVLYASAFPVVYAERSGDDVLFLTLAIPGEKRNRRVYHSREGYWYFREKSQEHGNCIVKRIITIDGKESKQEIFEHMDRISTDYCMLPCEIEKWII